MNRRELFAVAGALVVAPLLPAELPILTIELSAETRAALVALSQLVRVPPYCESAEIEGVVYRRLRYWIREGVIHDSWAAPGVVNALELRGTVSV